MRYSPGARNGNEYCPEAEAFVSRRSAVLAFSASTLACGTAAPLWSETVPVIVPLVCASSITDANHAILSSRVETVDNPITRLYAQRYAISNPEMLPLLLPKLSLSIPSRRNIFTKRLLSGVFSAWRDAGYALVYSRGWRVAYGLRGVNCTMAQPSPITATNPPGRD